MKHGFWNSIQNASGVGDRLYDAEDLTRYYKYFYGDGICPNSNNTIGSQFLVDTTTLQTDGKVKVNSGIAFIGGQYVDFTEDGITTVSLPFQNTVAAGYKRCYQIILKKEPSIRSFRITYRNYNDILTTTPDRFDAADENTLVLANIRITSSWIVDLVTDTREDAYFCGMVTQKFNSAALAGSFNSVINTHYFFATGVDDNIALSNFVQDLYGSDSIVTGPIDTYNWRDIEVKVVFDETVNPQHKFGCTNFHPSSTESIKFYFRLSNPNSGKNRIKVNFEGVKILINETATSHFSTTVFNGTSTYILNLKLKYNILYSTFNSGINYVFYGSNNVCKNSFIFVENFTTKSVTAISGGGFFEDVACYVKVDASVIATSQCNCFRPSSISDVLNIINCKQIKCIVPAANTAQSAFGVSGNLGVVILKNSEVCGIKSSGESAYKNTNTVNVSSGKSIIKDNILQTAAAGTVSADVIISDNLIYPTMTQYNWDTMYFHLNS